MNRPDFCRPYDEKILLGSRMSGGGCRVSPGSAPLPCGFLKVLPAGPGPDWWSPAGTEGPRPGCIAAAAARAACRLSRSDEGHWGGGAC